MADVKPNNHTSPSTGKFEQRSIHTRCLAGCRTSKTSLRLVLLALVFLVSSLGGQVIHVSKVKQRKVKANTSQTKPKQGGGKAKEREGKESKGPVVGLEAYWACGVRPILVSANRQSVGDVVRSTGLCTLFFIVLLS